MSRFYSNMVLMSKQQPTGETAKICFVLSFASPAQPTKRSKETSLHFAARMGQMEIVNMLLKAGADPNVVGLYGTCIDIARAYNQTAILEVLQIAAGGTVKKKRGESLPDKPVLVEETSNLKKSSKASVPSQVLRINEAKVCPSISDRPFLTHAPEFRSGIWNQKREL